MCNDYANHIPYRAYVEALSALRIALLPPASGAIPNLEPREDIRPTDPAPIIRGGAEGGAELAQLRWGFFPSRPKAPPAINFRSEGRAFTRGRCLVPASHFFEFTGKTYPKTKWKFTKAGEDWLCFAGIWRPESEGEGKPGGRFALLTTGAGPDMAPYHDRQPAILERERWAAWLDPAAPAAPMLRPSRAGTLRVEQVKREGALL